MPEYELLDTGPEPGHGARRRQARALGLLVAAGLVVALLTAVLREDDQGQDNASACRQEPGVAWCTAPSPTMTDAAIVRLVRGYCPRLRALALEEVVPQPLARVGLPSRPGELVLRTGNPGAGVESGLLGRPGRLAWVVRRIRGAGAWQLQVVCHNGADRAPALELDEGQLRSSLRADSGQGGLDLREAARLTARAVHVSPGGRLSLGTFRCRTTPSALDLQAGARFPCSLELFSDQGQAVYPVTYAVRIQPPYLHRVS